MADALIETKRRLQSTVGQCSELRLEPIAADPWIISSLLQKSIRRGETEIAPRRSDVLETQRLGDLAAFDGHYLRGRRRGNIDAVVTVVASATDPALRKSCGGDERVAVYLAGILATAPKDRSADHLCGAKDHPALAKFAHAMARAPLAEKLLNVGNKLLPLWERAVAAWFTSGLGENAGNKADREALLACCRDLGVPEELLIATGLAAACSREPITVMVPLIWLAVDASRGVRVCDCPIPPLVKAGDVPLYALDEHTRLGRQAIWRFACENEAVRSRLELCVPASQRRRAANVTAFYTDAAPVARRLVWDQSERVDALGLERDFLHAGVPAEAIQPLLATMRANLGHLNELRAQVLSRSQAGQAATPATLRGTT